MKPRGSIANMDIKSALVTGGSRGIGRGIATELARAGFRVAINYAENAKAAAEAVALVRAAGGEGFAVKADIALAGDRRRLLDEALGRFGRIDLLVNNAGVAPAVRADILEAGEESFDRLIAINLKGPYFLTQLAACQMLRQETDPPALAAGSSRSPRSPPTRRPRPAATIAWRRPACR